MKSNTFGKTAQIVFLLATLTSSIISISRSSELLNTISSTGLVTYWPMVDVNVNHSEIIGTNNLSLGFMLEHEWRSWRDSSNLRQLSGDAGFKMIRLFSHRLEPCTYWNEPSRTGSFDWVNVNSLVQRIFEEGAEPLITLGYYNTATGLIIPPGMVTDPATGLPHPESFAAYCTEWARHFKQKGMPVRYYEIINEPWMYFGWDDYGRIANFMAVFNAAAKAMRQENPDVLLSFDGTNRKPVLDYWLDNGGADLDFISFHKYDAGIIGRYSDDVMFNRAETFNFETSSGRYGVDEVRQVYFDARSKLIHVINSESNFNSAWETGSDPKIQQMVGAVWLALVLRTGVLKGLSYNLYFCFSSSASWEQTKKASGGVGFGMINSDDDKPWYPYYVKWMIGNGLSVGDSIVESTSSSDEIRVLSWINEEKLNILLVCKVDESRTIRLHGVSSQLDFAKVDNLISWQTASLQTGVVNATDLLTLNGYTVMWLQSL